jgi:hypothetical protein
MNQQLVKEVIEVREKAPRVAKEIVFRQHKAASEALKKEKADALAKKVRGLQAESFSGRGLMAGCPLVQLKEDEQIAIEKADRIKRLRADNDVIRKQVSARLRLHLVLATGQVRSIGLGPCRSRSSTRPKPPASASLMRSRFWKRGNGCSSTRPENGRKR